MDHIPYIPFSEWMLNNKGIYAYEYTFNGVANERFHSISPPYPEVIKLAKLLIEKGYDVWFLTMPVGSYHKGTSIQQKRA